MKELDSLEKRRQELAKLQNKIAPIFILLPVVMITTLALTRSAFPFLLATAITGGLLYWVYYEIIMVPFEKLHDDVRKKVLAEIMSIYNPNFDYNYFRRGKDAKKIIKSARLISGNECKEEDAIEGTYQGNHFYLSEITLHRKSGNNEEKVFDGMLFHVDFPDKNFPDSTIQNSVGLIKELFFPRKRNSEYGFWIQSEDEVRLKEEIGRLYPFILHLMKSSKDVRIRANGRGLTILFKSDVKFMDDPEPSVEESFKSKTYYTSVSKQLHTFLYIIQAISSGVSEEEIEEQLKLRVIEHAEKKISRG